MILTSQLHDITINIFKLNKILTLWGDQLAQQFNLNSICGHIIGILYWSNEKKTIPQLAEMVCVTRQGILKQINILCSYGILESFPNPEHKRSYLYGLTDYGRETYQKIHHEWGQNNSNNGIMSLLQNRFNKLLALLTITKLF